MILALKPIFIFTPTLTTLLLQAMQQLNYKYLAWLLCCILAYELDGQTIAPCRLTGTVEVPIDFYSTNEGLSQGMMNAMAVDSDGYLWLGTNAGLNRFDGRTFKVYRHNPADSASIASNHILGLHVDAQNRIWIGTEARGIDCFERTTETFTHYTTLNGLSSNTVGSVIRADKQGQIIVLHSDGKPADILVPANSKTNRFDVRKLNEVYKGIDKTTGDNPITGLYFTANGDMWYYAQDSLYHLTAKGLTTGEYTAFETIKYSTEAAGIFTIITDATKRYVYQPVSDGLNIYNEQTCKFVPFLKLAPGYKFWGRPYLDNNGKLWGTQANGTYIRVDIAEHTMEVMELATTPAIKSSLLSSHFWLQDRFGNVWVGTTGWGFAKINTRRELFKQTKQPHWHFQVVKPGIKSVFDAKITADWFRLIDNMDLKVEIQNPTFSSINYDNKGFYWLPVATNSKHMNLIKASPIDYIYKTITTHLGDGNRWFYIPLIIDKHNTMWYSERSLTDSVRLYHFNPLTNIEDSFAFPVKYDVVSYGFVSDWVEDSNDKLWLTTCKGLFVFDMQKKAWQTFPKLSNERLLSIYPDPLKPEQYLWIGSAGGGLRKLDKTTNQFITYTTANGLPDNIIYSIQTDRYNNLWLGTGNGLCLFNPGTLQTTNFSLSDGLPGTDFNSGQYSKAANGELYFGCVGGHFHFNPEDFYKQAAPATIAFTQLKLLNKPVNYTTQNDSANTYHLKQPIEQATELVFNYDQRMISFTFSLLDLSNAARNKYKYMLQGLNDNWIDNGYNNEAVFTNLSPGSYTLKVMAQSSSGVWSEPKLLSIIILAPWWATWWFRLLVLIAIAAALYALYSYRLQQIMRIEKMRNQIAQDLHDEIGSTLSSISLYSAVMQNMPEARSENSNSILNKIIESTSHMMESMNDMVWTIKADNDSFEQVVNRMRAFAVNMTEVQDIELHFTADKQAEKLSLDMSQRKNVYLIFKEAVNNAVKYSGCKNLRISIANIQDSLRLIVEDDGKGFDYESQLTSKQLLGGNGLRGMQLRAREINSTLKLTSVLQKGTKVELVMPVKNH